MSLLPDTLKALLARQAVQVALLATFEFTSTTVRLWSGNGVLQTLDGESWNGIGSWGAVDGIEQAMNGEAPEATFTLLGTDAEIAALVREEFADEVAQRPVRLHLQFFGQDDPADPGNQRVLDDPWTFWSARCFVPVFILDEDSGEESIAITAEGLFARRSRPRYAMYTDADQQARHAGDKGFQFVSELVKQELTWPDY